MIAIRTPRARFQGITNQNIGWAVYLGANTPKRLALEWGIGRSRAIRLLKRAEKARVIVRQAGIHYAVNSYFVAREFA